MLQYNSVIVVLLCEVLLSENYSSPLSVQYALYWSVCVHRLCLERNQNCTAQHWKQVHHTVTMTPAVLIPLPTFGALAWPQQLDW